MKKCSACGEIASPWLHTRDHNRLISNQEFTYFLCTSCGLIFLSPIPIDLRDYYQDDYFDIPTSIDQLQSRIPYEAYKIDILKHHISGKRVLEIGSGFGLFAFEAKLNTFDIECIESDPKSCDFLTNEIGVKAYNSDKPEIVIKDLGKYDAIVIWQAIEHIPSCWELLKQIPHHLHDKGVVIISTPNPESIQFRLFGKYWAHLDAPRHLQLIPIELMQRKCLDVGLNRQFITTSDDGSLWWNVFGWQYSFKNFARKRFFRYLLRMVGRIIGEIIGILDSKGRQAATYTAIFSKETSQ